MKPFSKLTILGLGTLVAACNPEFDLSHHYDSEVKAVEEQTDNAIAQFGFTRPRWLDRP